MRPVELPSTEGPSTPRPALDGEVERLVRVIRSGTRYALCACLAALVLATLAITL